MDTERHEYDNGTRYYTLEPTDRTGFGKIPTQAPTLDQRVAGGVCGTESAAWIRAETPALGEVSLVFTVYK